VVRGPFATGRTVPVWAVCDPGQAVGDDVSVGDCVSVGVDVGVGLDEGDVDSLTCGDVVLEVGEPEGPEVDDVPLVPVGSAV